MSENERYIKPEAKPKIITLDDLIDQNRAIPAEYEPLIRAQEQDDSAPFLQDQAYHSLDITRDNEQKRWLAERLKGCVLIDLGGGQGSMQKFAADFGVTTYVCVDKVGRSREAPTDPLHPQQESDPTETLHEIDVKADMLDFISRLKDRSANLTINGIDNFVINNEDYHYALARELARVVKDGGIIFGLDSDSLNILKRYLPPELQIIRHPRDYPYQSNFIFERTK